MNKLYHCFSVYSYKGGELCSNINQTIENIASNIYVDWEEIYETCRNYEKFDNMSDEEFFSLNHVQLLNLLDDKILKDIAKYEIYPGNTYAFDSHSDYEFFTINEDGKLEYVNIIEEPGFIEAFRKNLLESAEYLDNRNIKE